MKEKIYYHFLEFGKTEPKYVAFGVNESYLMVRVTLQPDDKETKEKMEEFKGWEIENLIGLRDKVILGNLEPFPTQTSWRNLMKELENRRKQI